MTLLNARQRSAYDAACSHIDARRLTDAVSMLIDTASPTGEEGHLARAVVARLRAQGIAAEEQPLDPLQSNAVATLKGTGGGTSLLLFSPLDTVTSNSEGEDVPWADGTMQPEMRAKAVVRDGFVWGLGAQNPKGGAACAMAAIEAVRAAGVELKGDLRLGLAAGGMPSFARPGTREECGHGAGAVRMLALDPHPDCAVIAKTGWAVSWEEVGFAWYEVRVGGTHTYVGSRHLLPYSNAIANAAKLILGLEEWFPEWAAAQGSDLVLPQGVVAFVDGGLERSAAFTPAICRFRVDLRLNPRRTPEEADAIFGAKVEELAGQAGIEATWQRIAAVPGVATPPDAPIIRTCIAAWEEFEGRPHQPIRGLSGATDANMLRAAGIPTARVGLSKPNIAGLNFQNGMNVVSIDEMVRLTRYLTMVAIATCSE